MSKISVGDYVVDEYGNTGHVIFCRGGYVGTWKVKFDSGSIGYKSSRDLTVLATSECKPKPTGRRLSVNEKLDLLFDYLNIEIEDTPRIVKRSDHDEISGAETPEKLSKES